MIYAALSFHGTVFTQPFSPVIEDTLKESLGFLSFTSEERVTSTKGEQAMTKEEYRNFLRDLEHKIFSEYPLSEPLMRNQWLVKLTWKSTVTVSTKWSSVLTN